MPATYMGTEADTCRTQIVPKLQAAGWETDPHSITEQRYFSDGRIIVPGIKTAICLMNSILEQRRIVAGLDALLPADLGQASKGEL